MAARQPFWIWAQNSKHVHKPQDMFHDCTKFERNPYVNFWDPAPDAQNWAIFRTNMAVKRPSWTWAQKSNDVHKPQDRSYDCTRFEMNPFVNFWDLAPDTQNWAKSGRFEIKYGRQSAILNRIENPIDVHMSAGQDHNCAKFECNPVGHVWVTVGDGRTWPKLLAMGAN